MEDFVKRIEFDNLKKEVDEIKEEQKNSKIMLQKIDKKIDIISEKLETSDKLSNLQDENIKTKITAKIEPLEKDIEKNKEDINELKDNNKFLKRTIVGALIGFIVELVFTVSAYMINLPK